MVEVDSFSPKSEARIRPRARRRPSSSSPGRRHFPRLGRSLALDLDYIPGHLLIVGGGYIGLEITQAMRRFGSRVTIIERNARLAHREDQDVSDTLHDVFREEGIDVVTSAHIRRAAPTAATTEGKVVSKKPVKIVTQTVVV
jgi:pyruvate/2-oxoglutarate dehydrogenase complex dihydrolipoamide dehydrogenase (E3) component